MQLCFDATRFGFGLAEAVELAAASGVSGFEYTFDSFDATNAGAKKLQAEEKEYLESVRALCRKKNIEITGLRLSEPLHPSDKESVKKFKAMIEKLAEVANALSCPRLFFFMEPGQGADSVKSAEAVLAPLLAKLAKKKVKLVLSLSTPPQYRNLSLKYWRSLDPDEWRELLAAMPELSLSFSAADCAWQGIDYLKILPGLVSGIEHVEAADVEVNRGLLSDSGVFGPLWWRYRTPGKGQLDWGQIVEALKLYDYKGSLSIHLEDEFARSDEMELREALDSSVRLLAPLLKY